MSKKAYRFKKRMGMFDVVNGLFMILICFAFIYPFLYVAARSVMTEAERAYRPFAVIPNTYDWSGYRLLFAPNSRLMDTYRITILRTVVGTFMNLIFTAMTAYVLSRRDYPLRGFITTMMIFTMWFGGGLIPSYLVNRAYGLHNSFWVYIFPGLISSWNTMIMRNFFMAIPDSLEESARIDGANEMLILVCIILPLSKASLATIGLFYAVGHWNAWFDSMLYMSDRTLQTLQYMLRQILVSASSTEMVYSEGMGAMPPTELVRMASIMATTIPILCVYPFLQRYFVKGVLVGSLKG